MPQAMELSVKSAFYSTGQRCTAASRIKVTSEIYPLHRVDEGAYRLPGHGWRPAAGTDIGPVSRRSQLDQDLDYVRIGLGEGAALAAGANACSAALTASIRRPPSSRRPNPPCV